jgi:hypothetical protein
MLFCAITPSNRNVRGALYGARWVDSAPALARPRFGYGFDGIDLADDPRSGGILLVNDNGQSYERGAAPG